MSSSAKVSGTPKKTRGCRLRSSSGKIKIKLPHGVDVTLGRSPATGIKDTRCSRQQIKLRADWATKTVTAVQLGQNPSKLRGEKLLHKDEEDTLYHRSTLELVPDTRAFRIEFDPPPTLDSVNATAEESTSNCAEEEDMGKRKSVKRTAEEAGDVAKKPTPVKKLRGSSDGVPPAECSGPSSAGWKSIENDKLLVYYSTTMEGSPKINCLMMRQRIWKRKSIGGDGPHQEKQSIEQPVCDQHNSSILAEKIRVKIAAFDMDGTLITTKSGKVFPVNNDDWKIIYPEVIPALKGLVEKGYKIILITNQAGVTAGKITIKDLKAKLEKVASTLTVPVQILASTGTSIYRKPNIGMWEYLETEGNGGVEIDRSQSFYCGDAAGRVKDWAPKKKKDFSCGDRLFAMNLGIKFYTPEEYFKPSGSAIFGAQPKPAKFEITSFDPRPLLTDTRPLTDPPDAEIVRKDGVELVIMVGYPGSGKSHFCKKHLAPAGYVVANRDTLGSWQKCAQLLEKSLNDGKSVVVDNTNGEEASRKRFIEVAQKVGKPVRCFMMDVPHEQAVHNNRFRELTDTDHDKVGTVILNMYRSRYVVPNLSEGYEQIVKIRFKPAFDSEDDEKLYMRYLMEK